MRSYGFFLMAAVLFTSCKSQFPIAYNSDKARNPEYKAYIKTKKGILVSGEEVDKKNEAKLFKPTLYSINGTEYKSKDIQEYQDESGLYTNVDGSLTKALAGPSILVFKRTSTSTTYTPPSMGMGGRTSTRTSVIYYIKKAGQDDYKRVGLKSTNQLAEWTEDNADAYDQAALAQKWSKSIKLQRLVSWGAIVGGIAMMLNDPSAKESATPDTKMGGLGYGGLALFSGGIVNLNINLFHRRGKAGRAYATAINIYNEAPVKKKKQTR